MQQLIVRSTSPIFFSKPFPSQDKFGNFLEDVLERGNIAQRYPTTPLNHFSERVHERSVFQEKTYWHSGDLKFMNKCFIITSL